MFQNSKTAIHRRHIILNQGIAHRVTVDLPIYRSASLAVSDPAYDAHVVIHVSVGFAETHEFESHPIMNLVVLQSDVILVHSVPVPISDSRRTTNAQYWSACLTS